MESVTEMFELTSGRIYDRDMLFFLTRHRVATMGKRPNAQVFFRQKGLEWAYHDVDWFARDLALIADPEPLCYVLGPGGRLLSGGPGGFEEELVPRPDDKTELLFAGRIDRTLALVGEKRLVTWREPGSNWERTRLGDDSMTGTGCMRALEGSGPQNFYVAGDGGEIWHYTGQDFKLLETPVETTLRGLALGEGGTVYACGDSGVIVEGGPEGFRTHPVPDVPRDWKAVEWFAGRLYLADGRDLFALSTDQLQVILLEDQKPLGIHDLDTRDEHLLAVAGDRAYLTADGKTWKPVAF